MWDIADNTVLCSKQQCPVECTEMSIATYDKLVSRRTGLVSAA